MPSNDRTEESDDIIIDSYSQFIVVKHRDDTIITSATKEELQKA